MADGFLYDKISGARVNSRRNFLALTDPTQLVKVGAFNLGSVGSQAVTGVGFQPQMVGILGCVAGPAPADSTAVMWHVGFAAGASQWGGSVAAAYNKFASSADRHAYWRNDRVIANVGPNGVHTNIARLVSFDVDGFTLDVEQSTGVYCVYVAARAGGGYAVGTTLVPDVTGVQTLGGLSFQPSAVLIANGPGGLLQQDHEWVGVGAGDAVEQYSVWSGARKGVPFLSARYDTGQIVTFAESSSGSFGAGRVVKAQAALSSLTSDGFALNWSLVDPAQTRNFHWLAVAKGDVGRFLYDPTANDKTVPTSGKPVGLIGFGNDQIEEGWDPSRSGAGLGMSFLGSDLAFERTCSFAEGYPKTLSITANERAISAGSFGAHSLDRSGLSQVIRNLCDVVEVFGAAPPSPFIVGMNWRQSDRRGNVLRGHLGAA